MNSKKSDSLEEISKFLKTYNLPRLNHEDIGNLNKPIISEKTESLIKISQQTEIQDQMPSQLILLNIFI